MRYLIVLLSVLSVSFVECQGSLATGDPIPYTVASIPAALRENAHAVVRDSREEFVVHAPDAATHRVHYAVTVLNPNGDRYATLAIFYDGQHKISDIRGAVYDAAGQLVKKIKNKDIQDQSMTGYSLYDDIRIKYYEHQTNDYPYTIVYSYEDKYDGLLHCPRWQPVAGFGLSVESASFSVSAPTATPLRFHSSHVAQAPGKATEEAMVTTVWKATDLPAQQQEPFQPPLAQTTPVVRVAPTAFAYEDHAGRMGSWQSLGKWVYGLNAGRDQLPEATQVKVKQLISDVSDTPTKVRKLYEYMQSKTRYVSIQLGIGGYQPFPARTVDELGYGDCKALSNYMQSLLKVANIESYYTLVKAGPDASDIVTDFPSTQFNHAILCVPVAPDTLWLECTNQTNPFGYTGYFTSDRHVLLIDEDGGHLAKTPHYSQEQNTQTRHGVLTLDQEGSGTLDVTTEYRGLQYAHVDDIVRLPNAEQKKRIYERTDIPNFRLVDYRYRQEKGPTPVTEEQLSLTLDGYASVSGSRLFVQPNALNRWDNIPKKRPDRQTEVEVRHAYVDTDSIEIILPENLHAEYAPEPTVIESPFGEYRSSYAVAQGRVVYHRVLRINRGTIPAEQYDDMVDFYQSVAGADRQKIVLKQGT